MTANIQSILKEVLKNHNLYVQFENCFEAPICPDTVKMLQKMFFKSLINCGVWNVLCDTPVGVSLSTRDHLKAQWSCKQVQTSALKTKNDKIKTKIVLKKSNVNAKSKTKKGVVLKQKKIDVNINHNKKVESIQIHNKENFNNVRRSSRPKKRKREDTFYEYF